MIVKRIDDGQSEFVVPQIPEETGVASSPPWELLEAGRYMPRRIRGSFRGRELG